MAFEENRDVPVDLRPDPADFACDLEQCLLSVVSVKTRIPDNALTATGLGTEREGHGVVINDSALVLTIGYVVTEAESVWLVDGQGATVQGHVVGYDQESGFGLVQALGKIDAPALALGDSTEISKGDRMVLAGAGGLAQAIEVSIASIREFAGYWEYLLDSAFFSVPAHPSWSGAALIGEDGKLYGIGSLVLQTEDQQGNEGSANMIVPISHLAPVLDDLISFGRRNEKARPWLGWFVQESRAGLTVMGLVNQGPAEMAGLHAGDTITGVNGVSIVTLADLYRSVWGSGDAGVDINIMYERSSDSRTAIVTSIDRNSRLATSSLH